VIRIVVAAQSNVHTLEARNSWRSSFSILCLLRTIGFFLVFVPRDMFARLVLFVVFLFSILLIFILIIILVIILIIIMIQIEPAARSLRSRGRERNSTFPIFLLVVFILTLRASGFARRYLERLYLFVVKIDNTSRFPLKVFHRPSEVFLRLASEIDLLMFLFESLHLLGPIIEEAFEPVLPSIVLGFRTA
jgi:hypothetical protein